MAGAALPLPLPLPAAEEDVLSDEAAALPSWLLSGLESAVSSDPGRWQRPAQPAAAPNPFVGGLGGLGGLSPWAPPPPGPELPPWTPAAPAQPAAPAEAAEAGASADELLRKLATMRAALKTALDERDWAMAEVTRLRRECRCGR